MQIKTPGKMYVITGLTLFLCMLLSFARDFFLNNIMQLSLISSLQ